MESSTKSPFLDQFGIPFPERIQHVLDNLTVKFRRKFWMIRDDVVAVDILEQAGRQIMAHEADNGTAAKLHGLAWVTIRNVAISRLRRGPHLLEQAIARSAKSDAALSRLKAVEGSPKRIESSILFREVLDHLNERERKIAIWKKGEYSSQFIAEKLGMSASSVDTAYSRLREKVRRMIGRGRRLGL